MEDVGNVPYAELVASYLPRPLDYWNDNVTELNPAFDIFDGDACKLYKLNE